MARSWMLIVGALSMALAACAPLATPISLAPTIHGPEIRALEVSGNMTFAPGRITFTVGQRVKITFINEGTVSHEIRFAGLEAKDVEIHWFGAGRIPQEKIEEFNQLADQGIVAAFAAPGRSVVVEFTPTATGSFEYFCTIPGHAEHGVGELIVR